MLMLAQGWRIDRLDTESNFKQNSKPEWNKKFTRMKDNILSQKNNLGVLSIYEVTIFESNVIMLAIWIIDALM